MWPSVYSSIIWMYDVFFRNALWTLYREGPSFQGYGFWQGHSNSYICSYLTNYDGVAFSSSSHLSHSHLRPNSNVNFGKSPTSPSIPLASFPLEANHFWDQQAQHCLEIIQRDFRQYEITLLAILYIVIVYKTIGLICVCLEKCLCGHCWSCKLCRWLSCGSTRLKCCKK